MKILLIVACFGCFGFYCSAALNCTTDVASVEKQIGASFVKYCENIEFLENCAMGDDYAEEISVCKNLTDISDPSDCPLNTKWILRFDICLGSELGIEQLNETILCSKELQEKGTDEKFAKCYKRSNPVSCIENDAAKPFVRQMASLGNLSASGDELVNSIKASRKNICSDGCKGLMTTIADPQLDKLSSISKELEINKTKACGEIAETLEPLMKISEKCNLVWAVLAPNVLQDATSKALKTCKIEVKAVTYVSSSDSLVGSASVLAALIFLRATLL